MSTKQPAKVQANFKTSVTDAPFRIFAGILLMLFGVLGLIACVIHSQSLFFFGYYRILIGLGGSLCFVLPVFAVWFGATVKISVRHNVAGRACILAGVSYLLLLTVMALFSYFGSVPYITFLNAGSYFDYIKAAYAYPIAGGALGMILAYPLSRILGNIPGGILMALLLAVSLLGLFRINPGKLILALSERKNGRPVRQNQEKQTRSEPDLSREQPPVSETVSSSGHTRETPSQKQQDDFYYTDGAFDAVVAPARPVETAEQMSFELPPDLTVETPYEAPQPLQAQPARQNADTRITPEPAVMENREKPATRKKQTADRKPLPFRKVVEPLPADDDPLPWEDTPANAVPETPVPEVQPPIAEPVPEDDWNDVPEPAFTVPAPAPVREKVTPVTEKPVKPPVPAYPPADVPKPQPVPSYAMPPEPENRDPVIRRPVTQSSVPKPVYTDAAFIPQGRISVQPQDNVEREGAKIDGTMQPAPKPTQARTYDPYVFPPMSLLKAPEPVSQTDTDAEDSGKAAVIEQTLKDFGIESSVKEIVHGPSITRFAIQIAPGVKVSKVLGTADNLELELKTGNIRMESPIKNTKYIGVEVPNDIVSNVTLREVLDSAEMKKKTSPLLVSLGKAIDGTPILCELSKMPHLLIAGTTGSGKSVCINSIICSILYRATPEQVRLILVDPKQVELSDYNGIPHLLTPVISDLKKAANALSWVVQEMQNRYKRFSSLDQSCRNLEDYNSIMSASGGDTLPNIVVIIDEMADLMIACRKEVEEYINRLAALARAAGIYMVLATQRPSVDVITGVVKNNIPSRIAFSVSSGTDSRTILDTYGAEKLRGKGDMLYKPTGNSSTRVQGCYISNSEISAITQFVTRYNEPRYDSDVEEHLLNDENESPSSEPEDTVNGEELSEDELLRQAIRMAVEDRQTSVSMLQRRLRIGYARAGRLVDEMEKRGVISSFEGSKARKTIMTMEQFEAMYSSES